MVGELTTDHGDGPMIANHLIALKERTASMHPQRVVGPQLTIRRVRMTEAGHHVLVHDAVNPQISVGRTALQVGVEGVPDQIVEIQAVDTTGDECLGVQPRPHVRRLVAYSPPEQILGCLPGVRAHRQSGGMSLARHLADYLCDQRLDEIGSIREVLGHVSAGSCRIGEQGECQRVAPTQGGEPILDESPHPCPLQQFDTLGRAQRAERLNRRHGPPARVDTPRSARRLPAGEHHNHLRVQ